MWKNQMEKQLNWWVAEAYCVYVIKLFHIVLPSRIRKELRKCISYFFSFGVFHPLDSISCWFLVFSLFLGWPRWTNPTRSILAGLTPAGSTHSSWLGPSHKKRKKETFYFSFYLSFLNPFFRKKHKQKIVKKIKKHFVAYNQVSHKI
jgi:hypothetical protein